MFPMRSVLIFIVLMSCSFDHAASKNIQIPDESQFKLPNSSRKICLTKTCNDTASEISRNMDNSVDPCDDFYQFACGGWIESAIIPNNSKSIRIATQKHKTLMNQLEMSLNETIKENEPRPLKMVKAYFQSCTDESSIEKKSVDSLLQIMKSVGGWPLIEGDKWNETNFDWIESVNELQKMGYFIDNMPQVHVDDVYPNWAILLKREPSSLLFRKEADNETLDILREDLVNITVALGANRTFAEKEVQELFEFVSDLYHLNDVESIYHKLEKFSVLKNSSAGFPVKKYIEELILPFSKIENNTNVYWADSIDGLKTMMEKKPKRVQANYIIWSAISQSVESLNKDIREKYEKLLKDGGFESPLKKYPSRTEECMGITKRSMPVSLSALYIRNHFEKNLKDDTITILENIRKQIVENVDASTRLSQRMKDIFRAKIERVKVPLAYDGDFFNDTEIEKVDRGLNISSSNDYLHNNNNLMRYMMGKLFTNLQEPTTKITYKRPFEILKVRRDWLEFDFRTSKLYQFLWSPNFIAELNAAIFPVGSLQGVMNKIENPGYIKYAAIGFLLGHELYHAIDSEHRRWSTEIYDYNYWNDSDKEIFDQQDKCFIEQYNNISLGDTKMDGKKTLQENTADYGGIKAAYLAYSDWASKRNEPEPLLPNLPYTQKQMFWISLVNSFCTKRRDPNSYNVNDDHTPEKVRFLGAFGNMPEFSKDFNCPVESKMDPSNKCFV